jgi:hypothetical protein
VTSTPSCQRPRRLGPQRRESRGCQSGCRRGPSGGGQVLGACARKAREVRRPWGRGLAGTGVGGVAMRTSRSLRMYIYIGLAGTGVGGVAMVARGQRREAARGEGR